MNNKPNKSLDTIKSFIINYLSLKILNGSFKTNHIVPSENILAERFGCSRLTARSAILVLVHLGILYTIKGSGHYVSENAIKILLPTLYIGEHSNKIKNKYIKEENENKVYESKYYSDDELIGIVHWKISAKLDADVSKFYNEHNDFSKRLIDCAIIGTKICEKTSYENNLVFITHSHYDEKNSFLFEYKFWYKDIEDISTKVYLKT